VRFSPRLHFALFSLAILSLLTFVGCTKEDYIENIGLPVETAVMDASRYAVVVEPYVTFRDRPQDDGITSSHARAGEIFEVQAIKLDKINGKQVIWIELKDAGWLTSGSIKLYPTKEKATVASRKLK